MRKVTRRVIREGTWNCTNCGAQKNPGGKKFCPGCGASRDQKETISRDPNAPEITNPKILLEARSGPEWNCEHCGSANPHDQTHCTTCGAESGTSPERPTHQIALEEKGKTPELSRNGTVSESVLSRRILPSKLLLITAGIISAAVLSYLVFFLFIQTKEHTATVTGFQWTRTVTIEELVTYSREGWDPPPDARITHSEERAKDSREYIHHYETEYRDVPYEVVVGEYLCGSKDLGNGYYEDVYCEETETRYRSEPFDVPIYATVLIYATYYWFEVQVWEDYDTLTKTGTDLSPQWPDFTLWSDQRPVYETPRYTLHLTDTDGESREYHTEDESYWKSFTTGQKVTLKINRVGAVLSVES